MKIRSIARISVVLAVMLAIAGCGRTTVVSDNEIDISDPAVNEQTDREEDAAEAATDKADEPGDAAEEAAEAATDMSDEPEDDPDDISIEYSHDDRSFTVNGRVYDVTELDDGANAVMDVWQSGDWVIADCHISPHFGMYYFVNIFTGEIDKKIMGANLTWFGDDITTAVYSVMGDVYNFKDHVVCMLGDDEVYDIKYNSTGDQIIINTLGGNTYTEYVDNEDTAMYRYADYLRHPTEDRWNKFMEEAPEGAVAFVMDTPPWDVAALLLNPIELTTDTPECFYVVSLEDGTDVRLARGDMDIDTWEFTPSSTVHSTVLDRGEACGYRMVIPEGQPYYAVYFIAGNKRGMRTVSILTGETDRCSEFVVR